MMQMKSYVKLSEQYLAFLSLNPQLSDVAQSVQCIENWKLFLPSKEHLKITKIDILSEISVLWAIYLEFKVTYQKSSQQLLQGYSLA